MIIKLEEKNKRKSTPWCHSPCTLRPPFAYNFYCKPHRLHVQSHRRWPVGSNKSYRRMHLVVRKLLPSPLPVGLFQHYALCSAPPNPTIQQNLWRSRIEKCTVNLLYIYIYIYLPLTTTCLHRNSRCSNFRNLYIPRKGLKNSFDKDVSHSEVTAIVQF